MQFIKLDQREVESILKKDFAFKYVCKGSDGYVFISPLFTSRAVAGKKQNCEAGFAYVVPHYGNAVIPIDELIELYLIEERLI